MPPHFKQTELDLDWKHQKLLAEKWQPFRFEKKERKRSGIINGGICLLFNLLLIL
jgi:hypothetical protein